MLVGKTLQHAECGQQRGGKGQRLRKFERYAGTIQDHGNQDIGKRGGNGGQAPAPNGRAIDVCESSKQAHAGRRGMCFCG
jgi:hypothetical protein